MQIFSLLLRVNYARWSLCNFQHHYFQRDAKRIEFLQELTREPNRTQDDLYIEKILRLVMKQSYAINQYRRVVQHFSNGFLHHILMKIDASEWSPMVKSLIAAGNVSDMRNIHVRYLQEILHSCLLTS